MIPDPRNWKWLVPASASPFVFVAAYFVSQMSGDTKCWAAPIFGVAVVLLIAGWKNYVAYFSTIETENYATTKKAESLTPEVRLAEAFQGMPGDTARLLLLHRKAVMMIKSGPYNVDDWADMVFEDCPTVHLSFAVLFFRSSKENDTHCMSKRLLSEGSKKLDPSGLVSDRQQYEDFCAYLHQRMYVTKPYGDSQPPEWLGVWTPETVAKALGVWPWVKQEDEEPEKI